MILKEDMIVSYKDMKGKIMFVCDYYVTFNPIDSKSLLLIYKSNWTTVTVL
jgi:hypothetical protein